MRFKPDFMIDLHWLNRMSHRLDLFRRVSSSTHVYESRCIICGDSKKNTNKARCHFYEKQRALNVHCKNCGYSHSFYTFMKDAFRNDFPEYRKEQLRQRIETLSPNKNSTKTFTTPTLDDPTNEERTAVGDVLSQYCTRIDKLDRSHHARKYLESRKLTTEHLERLYYTETFKKLSESISHQELSDRFPDEERIVIPFFSEDGETLEMIQGRSLAPKSSMRYISIKSDPEVDKIFGKNEIDPTQTVYCVEGPFDSLFVDNCVATCDSMLIRADADVYIYDNEPRNKEIVTLMEKTIELGKQVVIWPVVPMKKLDINDMIIGGITTNELMSIIRENTFGGMKAKLKLFNWRKV